ncbi:deoxyribose-phosphate aldolase [Gynurincola endophyticus]|uniref:deoxyribose-phosphate aldolase n=1 Tax=Gynurincola endophyticus TaxID=2479004 RepID=UPI000F8E50E3|nr:deoxyribose-phosphate aldolase [Gynurincola endophyticus]
MNIAAYIDHTILKANTSVAEIEKLCAEAREFQFAAVCVPPPYIKLATELLAGTNVKTATVIGFPFGYANTAAKMAESQAAIKDGADELDVVVNLIEIKRGNWDYLKHEISDLTQYIHQEGKIIKVIVESGILSEEELIKCCEILGPVNIDFMKTSTGYAEKGASTQAVEIMRAHLPQHIQIKASGGIRDYTFAAQLVNAGATRLGCSAGVAIVKGENNSANIGDY